MLSNILPSTKFFFAIPPCKHQLLLPLTWFFFISFQSLPNNFLLTLHFEAKLFEYLDFYMAFYYSFVFYFQVFVVLSFFIRFQKQRRVTLQKFRKAYYYIFLLLSTLISQLDAVNQLLLLFIIICCYEVFLFAFIVKSVAGEFNLVTN